MCLALTECTSNVKFYLAYFSVVVMMLLRQPLSPESLLSLQQQGLQTLIETVIFALNFSPCPESTYITCIIAVTNYQIRSCFYVSFESLADTGIRSVSGLKFGNVNWYDPCIFGVITLLVFFQILIPSV